MSLITRILYHFAWYRRRLLARRLEQLVYRPG